MVQPSYDVRLSQRGARRESAGPLPAVVLGDLSLVRPLVWSGVPVVVGSDDRQDPCLRSRHVREHFIVPGYGEETRERSAAILREVGQRLCETWGQRLPLFYGSDGQLALLYDHRASLEPYFRFTLSPDDVGRAMLDKLAFARLCEERRVSAPRSCQLDGDKEEALFRLRPPLLVKPRLKTDWHQLREALFDGQGKARVFPDAARLLQEPAVQTARGALVVQEFVSAPVEELYSFHGFAAEDGRLLGCFCGRKVQTQPAFAGESAIIELVDDPRIEAFGREVVARLEVRGPFKIDLIAPPPPEPLVVLEVNARYNLWHHLGAAHGVNLPRIAYDYLVSGQTPVEPPAYQPRARWLSFYRVYQGFREKGHARPVAMARWAALSLRRPSVHDLFDWRDPVPFLAMLATLLGVGPVPA
jgi:D-aspartate ligase